MIPQFQTLEDAEIELLLKAPILVCILIAGADGTIDRKELKEAVAIAHQHRKTHSILTHYFKEMAEDFEDKLKIIIQSYPYESTQRTPLIVEELSRLNQVWKRLDKDFAIAFYQMLLSLAEKVASSSGGLLGMKKVDAAEARFMRLPMVQPPANI
jgi:tellurite resistance protein